MTIDSPPEEEDPAAHDETAAGSRGQPAVTCFHIRIAFGMCDDCSKESTWYTVIDPVIVQLHGYLRSTSKDIDAWSAVVNTSDKRLEALLLRRKALKTSSLQRTLQERTRNVLGPTGKVTVRAADWNDPEFWEFAQKGIPVNLDLSKPEHLGKRRAEDMERNDSEVAAANVDNNPEVNQDILNLDGAEHAHTPCTCTAVVPLSTSDRTKMETVSACLLALMPDNPGQSQFGIGQVFAQSEQQLRDIIFRGLQSLFNELSYSLGECGPQFASAMIEVLERITSSNTPESHMIVAGLFGSNFGVEGIETRDAGESGTRVIEGSFDYHPIRALISAASQVAPTMRRVARRAMELTTASAFDLARVQQAWHEALREQGQGFTQIMSADTADASLKTEAEQWPYYSVGKQLQISKFGPEAYYGDKAVEVLSHGYVFQGLVWIFFTGAFLNSLRESTSAADSYRQYFPSSFFDEADVDASRSLSEEEFVSACMQDWTHLDTRTQFRLHDSSSAVNVFRELDKNNDGYVSDTEFLEQTRYSAPITAKFVVGAAFFPLVWLKLTWSLVSVITQRFTSDSHTDSEPFNICVFGFRCARIPSDRGSLKARQHVQLLVIFWLFEKICELMCEVWKWGLQQHSVTYTEDDALEFRETVYWCIVVSIGTILVLSRKQSLYITVAMPTIFVAFFLNSIYQRIHNGTKTETYKGCAIFGQTLLLAHLFFYLTKVQKCPSAMALVSAAATTFIVAVITSFFSFRIFTVCFSLSLVLCLISGVLLSGFNSQSYGFPLTPRAFLPLKERQAKIRERFDRHKAESRVWYWFTRFFQEPTRFRLGQFSAGGTWRQGSTPGPNFHGWSPKTDIDELYEEATFIWIAVHFKVLELSRRAVTRCMPREWTG